MQFMNKFGLITARDPDGEYKPMTDVIHKVLNDITVDDWDVTIGGDSHTRMSKHRIWCRFRNSRIGFGYWRGDHAHPPIGQSDL